MGPGGLDLTRHLRERLPALLVAPCVLLIAVRQTGIAYGPLAASLALLPWAALAAALGVVLAARRRDRRATLVGLVAAALVVAWWLPAFRHDSPLPAPSNGAAVHAGSPETRQMRARIVSLNTMSEPDAVLDLAGRVPSLRPDVVALSELGAATRAAAVRAGIARELPYVLQPGVVDGLGIWSRWPITSVVAVPVRFGGYRITLQPPGAAPFTLMAVHTMSPRWFAGLPWSRDQRNLLAAVDEVAGRLVVVGDLNMTRDHLPFRELGRRGLVDAADFVGAGWRPTWSLGAGGPAIVAVDHVLTRGISVAGFATVRVAGTDHRAVSADLLLPSR